MLKMMIFAKRNHQKIHAYLFLVLLLYILFSYVLRVQEQKSKTYNTALRSVYILPVIRQLLYQKKMFTNNEPPTQHLAHHFRYMAMYHKHCACLIKAIQEKDFRW